MVHFNGLKQRDTKTQNERLKINDFDTRIGEYMK
jgi:hypothetical protein